MISDVLPPCGLGCEMLGKGKALSKADAKGYAEKNGFVFMEGREIWQKQQ